jgi:hypothetical protein
MRKLCSGIIAILLSLVTMSIAGMAQNPVVVELFTSEGCSSCPPADAVLLQLSQQRPDDGAQLILMGEHVDYWNYIGWTDRFSSKQFSDRQTAYAKALHAQVYTPQMVIDGQEQFVGNDAAEVHSRIAAAAKKTKPAQVSLAWESNGRLRVSVHSSQTAKADVLLAITEDGVSTQVAKGENGGKTLHHAAVVRQLSQIGEITNGSLEKTVNVAGKADWNVGELKVAVLVQDPESKKILGAGSVAFK